MVKQIRLKGPMHGAKIFKPYKNPDIIYSVIDNHKCQVNELHIEYLPENNVFYIYHSYKNIYDKNDNGAVYTGRWYNRNYSFTNKNLDENEKTFKIVLKSVAFEDFNTGNITQKDINVSIHFNSSGFNKLKKFFTIHNKSEPQN